VRTLRALAFERTDSAAIAEAAARLDVPQPAAPADLVACDAMLAALTAMADVGCGSTRKKDSRHVDPMGCRSTTTEMSTLTA
jgi:hypothetical protein